MPPDPLDALNDGFVHPARPEELNPRLRGPEGLRLMHWLQDSGVHAGLLRDVHVAFRIHGEATPSTQGLGAFQASLRGVVYARGFDAYPALANMLHAAVFHVTDWQQWEGLLRYLQALAQAMLVAGPRDRA